MDCRLKHPFRMYVSGPSASGKTEFVSELLENREILIDSSINRVLYYYQYWQPKYDILLNSGAVTDFIQGLPDMDSFERRIKYGATINIIDDAMNEENVNVLDKMFTTSRHQNASMIFLSQNFHHPKLRVINRNCDYVVLKKNPRDRSVITRLLFTDSDL